MAEDTAAVSDMPLLEMQGITKRFLGVLANDRVDFNVKAGEVHTLLGENGAGKSTLMNVLYGLHQPDEGEVLMRGEPIAVSSPSDAIAHGIGMVHQHFMLVPTLTVTENVALGLKSERRPLTDLPTVETRILELSEAYGLQVDPNAYVWQLAVGRTPAGGDTQSSVSGGFGAGAGRADSGAHPSRGGGADSGAAAVGC